MVFSSTAAPRIAVVGGGIGGLAAAAFLHRARLPCTVYEQAPRISEVGAGLVLAPNAVRLLRRLGVLETLESRAVPLDVGWEFRRWTDGRVLSAEHLAESCERLYGERTYTVHRAHLVDALRSAVPEEALSLGRRCVAVTPQDGVAEIRLADGSVVEADVVIGADGVHSLVRASVLDTTTVTPPTYSGICAFRALVPAERAAAFAQRRAQTLWIGPGHHLVHYPISGGELVNLVAFAPAGDYTTESWSATATVEEFLVEFEGWDERLQALIRNAGTPGRWALLDRAPLATWSRGPITLLGDAAHPMLPFFAQGAAQSIEDAAVLTRCLAGGTEVADALRQYETHRIARTARLQEISHARAHVNHLPDGPEQEARDTALSGADPLVANGWIYSYDAEADDAALPA